jgi:hypothetical protein
MNAAQPMPGLRLFCQPISTPLLTDSFFAFPSKPGGKETHKGTKHQPIND